MHPYEHHFCIYVCTNTNAYGGISISNHISTVMNLRTTIRTNRRVGHRIHSGLSINSNTNINQYCIRVRLSVCVF